MVHVVVPPTMLCHWAIVTSSPIATPHGNQLATKPDGGAIPDGQILDIPDGGSAI